MQYPWQTVRSDNLRMVAKLTLVTVMMFGFGYALVPMYKHICEALGINVLSLAEAGQGGGRRDMPANTQIDTSRTVTIEFDANAHGPWDFKPAMARVGPNRMRSTKGAVSIASLAARRLAGHWG